MKQTVRLAKCSMMAAVCVVMMLLGSVFGLGMYAAPLLVGLCLSPIGERYGRKYQIMLWLVVSGLSFMIVPELEQNLMFFGLFGWYPIAYPFLEKLPKGVRLAAKLAVFNAAVVAIEALVLLVFVPETLGAGWMIGLLILGNVVFVMYDMLIPKSRVLLRRLYALL